MGGFEAIEVSYNGNKKSIDPSRFIALGARIENVLTYLAYTEIVAAYLSGNTNSIKGFVLAGAYRILLDSVGIEYQEAELYRDVSNSKNINDVFSSLDSFYSQLYEPQEEEKPKPKKKAKRPRKAATKK